MGSPDTATWSEILVEKLTTSSANDSVLQEREPADPQLESFVDPFPELSRPRQESTDSNTENQANAKKRRVPTILDEDSDEDFLDSSPKQPHAKGHLTLWQTLPDLETEYSNLKQAAKKTFANRLLKCVKSPGVQLGGKVGSENNTLCCYRLNKFIQGFRVWRSRISIDKLPLTKSILSSLKYNQDSVSLSDLVDWAAYSGPDYKFSERPSPNCIRVDGLSYQKFLEIFSEVSYQNLAFAWIHLDSC